MAKAKVYNLNGDSAGDITLDDAVFAVAVNPELVSFVVNSQRANAHQPNAHTKGRADKRGGGRKPWKQKGTGRARHGSSRSPIWRGGGVTFGPSKDRNPEKKINKKQRRNAMKMVLTEKLNGDALIVLDNVSEIDGKTKQLSTLLNKLPTKDNSVLIASKDKNVPLSRAAGNIQKVNTIMADSINVGDLLKFKYFVVDKAGIEAITDQLK